MLIYGPDAGLVHERAEALAKATVDDVNDPFAFVRIDGDELAGNPSRLVEEAHTVPLFGGRRAVLVKAGSRNIAPAVELVVDAPSNECRVIIEAGDLRKTAPLRALCEKAKAAAALPCYLDGARDIARLIDEEMRAANLTLPPTPAPRSPRCSAAIASPRATSCASSRSTRKATSVSNWPTCAPSSPMPPSRNSTACSMPPLPATRADVETEFGKARAGGSARLHHRLGGDPPGRQSARMKLAVEAGDSIDFAMKRGAPPVHFSREKVVGEALRAWTPARLLRAMEQLAEASLEARRQPALAEAIAQRTLLSIAVSARRREK